MKLSEVAKLLQGMRMLNIGGPGTAQTVATALKKTMDTAWYKGVPSTAEDKSFILQNFPGFVQRMHRLDLWIH